MPLNGVHKMHVCDFCKKGMRSDKYGEHLKRHHSLIESVITESEELFTRHEDILIKTNTSASGRTDYEHGVCFGCSKLIINKNKFNMDVFINHECKEVVVKVKAPVAAEPVVKVPRIVKTQSDLIAALMRDKRTRSVFDDMADPDNVEEAEEIVTDIISNWVSQDTVRTALAEKYAKLESDLDMQTNRSLDLLKERDEYIAKCEGLSRAVEYESKAKNQFKDQIIQYDLENIDLKDEIKRLQAMHPETIELVE